MKAKKVLYSILLALFALVLAVDLAVFFLIPNAAAQSGTTERPDFSGGERPDFSGGSFSMPDGSDFTPPDGSSFSMPDGSDFTPPDGSSFSMPDGSDFTPPDGGSFTMPDGSSFPGGFSRRSDTASEDETTSDAALSGLSAQLKALLPTWLWNTLTAVRPYWLWILIGTALGMALCIVRLIFLGIRTRKLKAIQADDDALPARRRTALWPAILMLLGALVLVAVLFPADSTETSNEAIAKTEVLSGTAERGTVTASLIAAGSLAEQDAEAVTLPVSVELEAVAVQNGETVTEGQVLAKVSKTSAMVAIAAVQDAIAAIDEQLQSAHDAVGKTTLTAPTAGTVKRVYAAAGEDASDVMARDGSLMLLSLDGRMSVSIPASDAITADSELFVTLSDGTVVSGEITDRSEETVTVSVPDRNYPIGETVSVSDGNGTLLGSGDLFVHHSLNITAYLGTVTRIYKTEGMTVTAGTALFGLSDAADTAAYRTLLSQRAAYETELKTLFELYQYEVILAPCDGVVSGISDEIPYKEVSALLFDTASARFAAATPEEAAPADYTHYVGQVTANAGGTLSLNISMNAVAVSDYTDVSALTDADRSLSGTYSIASTVPVYTYVSGTWSTMPSSAIAAGDLVLFAFDENGTLVWVLCYPGAAPTPTPSPTATPEPSNQASPTPSVPKPSGGSSSGGSFHLPSGGGNNTGAVQEPAYRIAEQTLLSVTPQQTMTLSAQIDELDILSLAVGQRVEVLLDAFSGTSFDGTVTDIEPEGENSGGNTKYAVTVALARTDSMRAGMNGTVIVAGKTRTDALLLPLAALSEDGNAVTVWTGYDAETDTLLNPVPVETGVSDGTNVEILSGLSEGDPYFYRYADSVSYATGT